MNLTASDNQQFVDDVVAQLTGADEAESVVQVDLQEQMERASEDFDLRTANAFARALLESLCDEPSDVRKLEALLILGLAHPRILDRHRISLSVEGRRLAVLLERSGDVARARGLLEVLSARMPDEKGVQRDLAAIMRRTGKTAALVERYLSRANEAIAQKKPMQAIPWLQEVLLHDRNRRDIARMIRNLRNQESERKDRRARRNRILLAIFLFSTLITGVGLREKWINDAYGGIADSEQDNLSSMSTHLAEIDQLISKNKVWIGMFQAVSNRNRLRQRIDELKSLDSEQRLRAIKDSEERNSIAEAARTNGLLLAQRGEFDKALAELHRSLQMTSKDWEHRQRVEADIAAIAEWQKVKQ